MIRKNNGITLVALVITIIVLLILAGVTINLTLGERGIFSTAQKAAENYKTAQEKEFASLNSFENEIDDTIERMNRMSTKITSANYGDKVNYSANGETDWKIFYKDDNYVYLILSGYLHSSKIPEDVGMVRMEGKPYTTSFSGSIATMQDTTNYGLFRPQIEGVTTSYSLNSSNPNSMCVSTLANTSNWTSFVNTSYADFAIGAPTLEMWVASWNAKGYTKLYCNNTNANGYYVETSSSPTTRYQQVSSSTGYRDSLYFPVSNSSSKASDQLAGSDANGYNYWLASPSAGNANDLMCVAYNGHVGSTRALTEDYLESVRPIVRLKSTTGGEKVNGVWQLK